MSQLPPRPNGCCRNSGSLCPSIHLHIMMGFHPLETLQNEYHKRSRAQRVSRAALQNTPTRHSRDDSSQPFSERPRLLQMHRAMAAAFKKSVRLEMSLSDSTHVCTSTTRTATSSTRFNPTGF